MRGRLVECGVVVAALLTATAAAGTSASGSVEVGEDTVTVSRGVAFWDESTAAWEKGTRVLRIMLCDAEISTRGIVEALDVQGAIRRQIAGDYVVVTLNADRSFHDIYVLVADGAKNYGFNGGSAEIEALEAARVVGRAFTEGEQSIGDTPIRFDLRFDAEVLPEREPGAALPADGGAPGAAYVAYVRAQREGDLATLLRHMPGEEAETLRDQDAEWRDYRLESMREMAPREMGVTGGELFEGYAFLSVAGTDWSGDKVEGRVKMVRDGDNWRLAEEDLQYAW